MSRTSGPSPIVSVETRGAARLDLVDAHERRAAVGQAEEALEADGEVEVAARVEQALAEGLDAGAARPGAAAARSRRRCR